jgi:hypothetical protein
MAARLRPMHQDDVRLKIKTTQLIKRLEDHVLNGVKMEKTQVSAAMGLLKKTLPDLSAVEMTGKDGGPIETSIDLTGLDPTQLKALASVRIPADR